MSDPEALWEARGDLSAVPAGLPLVGGLTGFADAGSAVSQLGPHLLDSLEHELLVSFDADALLDYRARRPIIQFDGDHLTDYRPATLELHLVRDDLSAPFLLLTGFEPDFAWQGFGAAVLGLVDRLAVASTTWVHAIPMPVPHTRPIGLTVSGTRTDLVESMSIWRPTTSAPATALHLVEHRLQERGASVTGFVLLVPHYLSDTRYPGAAVTALESIGRATSLVLPADRLREADRDFIATIDEQVASNPELSRLVSALEERHDAYVADSPLPSTASPLMDSEGEMPSADEIAAELERFLAHRRREDD